ncbi:MULTISPECIES: HAD family hydrolase [Bacillus]|uniref:Phosphoglycolate phosphatase n=2 Tax=Bacillus TaxID=1386 RepID=A0A0M4GCA3_9BACI|nr:MULTISPECIES: HAD-IA family hydrolase [Bacillus]ALC83508.1 phosphoglycolate phosphatase [Bacillus gobiensis]MBP1082482.1 putative hydrolase of the HAD superfamily [Bacillus capparidis]MED1097281.1 HAD-IA family hydrolase [Bacillus capparidis]
MIKAIIFDFDGTIIDTETAWYVAFRDAYKEHGVELTLEKYSECLGTSLHSFNPYTYLSTHHNIAIDLDEFREAIQSRHTELMEKEAIRLGVLDYLKAAKAAGLKIGLATSSHMEWVEKYVNQLGIADYFDCFSTADDVENVKPDPAVYLKALDHLGVEASEAIAIEDSPNGARAAVKAGIHTVVIKNTITEQLPFSTGHHTIDSLESHELDELIENLLQKVK